MWDVRATGLLSLRANGRDLFGSGTRLYVFHSTGTFSWLRLKLNRYRRISHSSSTQTFTTLGADTIWICSLVLVKSPQPPLHLTGGDRWDWEMEGAPACPDDVGYEQQQDP